MAKKIDVTKTVFELTKEYPELIKIMADLGFSEITKPSMLHSVGRMVTIPKGAKMKQISMMEVVTALLANGFELEGEMPSFDLAGSPSEVKSLRKEEERPKSRKGLLKSYLKRLGNGEDLESVRADFVEQFHAVEATEIMEAEQELMKEGTPITEVQRLCDLHSALFHGATTEEVLAREEGDAEASSLAKRAKEELAKKDRFPQKDYSDKQERAATLAQIPGHPLYTFVKENEALAKLLEQFQASGTKEVLAAIRELSIHYAKKGDLLYPHLKVKYGVSGPSDVMWTVDDEIRDQLGALDKEKDQDRDWRVRLDAVLQRAKEMIYKEQNVLFPICAVNFTKEEWYGIYRDSKDYADCFGVENQVWKEAEEYQPEKPEAPKEEIVMPGGHLTLPQLTALLNTIPMEISFIDADNINRFFNEGPKVFKRPGMAIDRDVFSCHPPKIEPMVRSILEDFRKGVRDSVPVWMEKNGRLMLVTYMAVRDSDNTYLGTVELVQDMEFAKAHFQQ